MTELMQSPLVTLALIAYNQEEYIREAVEGALAQDYRNLEILISDDCSPDSTHQRMCAVLEQYSGDRCVSLRRNETNLGLTAHVNQVVAAAKGEIIVIAAGDDVSLPNRVSLTVELFSEFPDAKAVLLSADVIDDHSSTSGEILVADTRAVTQSLEHLLDGSSKTMGASRAFRRELFDFFGPLQPDCPTEDTPILLRSLLCGTNVLSSSKGIRYRRHDANISTAEGLARMNVDLIFNQYFLDLSRAATSGLLSESEICRFYKWAASRRHFRSLQRKCVLGERFEIKQYYDLLIENGFSLREKTWLLSQSFKTARS
ncbi:glycosyltransferase family 2 protein [Luteimonas sp. A537]